MGTKSFLRLFRFSLIINSLKQLLAMLVQSQDAPKSIRAFFDLHQWSSRKRLHLVLNLTFGFVILALLEFFSMTSFGQGMLNEAYDYLIREDLQRAEIREDAVSDALRLVLFSEAAYLNSPSLGHWTPRKRLLQTAEQLVLQGSKVILLDFRLDRPVPDADENMALIEGMEKLVALSRTKRVTIILPYFDKTTRGTNTITTFSAKFWTLVEKNTDVIKVGEFGFMRNPADNMVRHMRFYRIVENQGDQKVLLSVALLAAAYSQGINAGNESCQKLKAVVLRLEEDGKERRISLSNGLKIILAKHSSRKESIPARLKYLLAPDNVLKENKTSINPARRQLSSSAMGIQHARPGFYSDKIVVLGSDYKELGDIHFTPVGKMPGAYLIANAINMFLVDSQVHSRAWLNYLVSVIVIILVSFFIVQLPSILGIALVLLLFFVFKPLGVFLFSNYGLLFNYMVLVAGISLFDYTVNINQFIAERLFRGKKDENEA